MILRGGSIKNFVAHYVGNKSVDGTLKLTKNVGAPSGSEDAEILTKHFLEPFKEVDALYNFSHEIEVGLNDVYHVAQSIFRDNDTLINGSLSLAQILFNKSLHPQINPGDFFCVLFNDCIIEGEVVQALGLYKFENKQTFIKSDYGNGILSYAIEKGFTQGKVDKGALIININEGKGYKVMVIDKKNQSFEARYWLDDFLKLKSEMTAYSNTQSFLDLTKQFVTNQSPDEPRFNKVDQVDLLRKSVDYFKKHTSYNEEEFAEVVLGPSQQTLSSFRKFKSDFQNERDIAIADDFEISGNAVKKASRTMKSVIKLDKNFHVYIHGSQDLIERGVDSNTGKKFYKIYFDQES